MRTHLEYANAITYPQFEKEAKLLEGMQRRATKLVPQLSDLGYIDRLKALKLPSLLYRRKRGDMIEAFRYCHELYTVTPSPLHLDTGPPVQALQGPRIKVNSAEILLSAGHQRLE